MTVNLTQHQPTISQLQAGVVNLPSKWWKEVKGLITFDQPATQDEKAARATELAKFVLYMGAKEAMIGGAPFFMSTLERVLMDWGIAPMYSFSLRESEDCVQADGSVVKKSYFRHVAWDKAEKPPESCGNSYDCYCGDCRALYDYYNAIRVKAASIQKRLAAGQCPKCLGAIPLGPLRRFGYLCYCMED